MKALPRRPINLKLHELLFIQEVFLLMALLAHILLFDIVLRVLKADHRVSGPVITIINSFPTVPVHFVNSFLHLFTRRYLLCIYFIVGVVTVAFCQSVVLQLLHEVRPAAGRSTCIIHAMAQRANVLKESNDEISSARLPCKWPDNIGRAHQEFHDLPLV